MPIVATASSMNDIPNWFVCTVGMATVLIGLVCLIVLCWLVGRICRRAFARKEQPVQSAVVPAPAAPVSEDIPNRQQFVAAISAVIAEEMGSDVSRLRILSIKKI